MMSFRDDDPWLGMLSWTSSYIPGETVQGFDMCSHETFSAATRSGRVAGVDFGTVRIGIAITDPQRTIASPLAMYARRDPASDARYFKSLVEEERIAEFVVGLPVHLSGEESQKSHEARKFAKWLQQVTGAPVALFDERYTSVQAESMLQAADLTKKKRKQRIDMLAAQVMLSAYLESGETSGTKPIDDA